MKDPIFGIIGIILYWVGFFGLGYFFGWKLPMFYFLVRVGEEIARINKN